MRKYLLEWWAEYVHSLLYCILLSWNPVILEAEKNDYGLFIVPLLFQTFVSIHAIQDSTEQKDFDKTQLQ